jgi:TonB family protein
MKSSFLNWQSIFILIALLSSFSDAGFCNTFPLALIQEQSRWDMYVPRGEEFSILLPQAPSLAFKWRFDKKTDDRYKQRIYGAYGDGIAYVIISENKPRRAKKLDTFISEFRESLPHHKTLGPSVLKFDHEITLTNFSGKRFRVTFYNGIEGIVDFYITSKHVYIVELVGGNEDNPSIQRFLKSFSLEENVPGKHEEHIQPAVATPTQDQPGIPIFSAKEVTRPAFAITRPEPFYTEEAKQNQEMGTVVMRAVLTSSGKISDIRVIQGLKYGLTEKAVEAASKMMFIPAMKDGQFVSQYLQIEYNFNLY